MPPKADFQNLDWLRQMENILETLNEGVVILDDDLIVFANEALHRLGGYERGELRNRGTGTFFPPEHLPYLMEQHAIAQQLGRHRHEYYVPRKDGGHLPAIISGRIITAADGRQYSVLTITDISNQKHVEEELRRANAQLEQRQKEIEEELALAARVQQ